MLDHFIDEFRRYRTIGERALAQLPDAALDRVPAPDANSAAMLVRHVSGNLVSRFTDFLATDGEKPWRDRDSEFVERSYSRAEVGEMWAKGWSVLEGTLATLSDADLGREVMLRGQKLSVHAALCRALAHVAYHVGQLVLLAREGADASWQWISIPKGASAAYDPAPAPAPAPAPERGRGPTP